MVQLRDGLSLRAGTRNALKLRSGTLRRLRTGTTWLTPGPSLSTTSVLTRLLTFFVKSVLRTKKVSIILVSADSSHVHLGFPVKRFPLAEMTTKFNKDMYAKMRSKKDEPLSNLGKKTVRVTGKCTGPTPLSFVHPIASETTRTTSPTTSIEEIPTPDSKRPRMTDKEKEKEKVDTRSSTIWDDERLAVDRAHKVVTPADLRALSDMSLNEVASRHVHKLVQVRCSPSTPFSLFFFFTDDSTISSRCWERASILPPNTSIKRPRWHL